jgi:deoxycytidine triphosphate deaminase
MLSDKNITKLLNKEIVIFPYKEENLTPIGYNLTPSDFAVSINKNELLQIEDGCYIVEPNDTALILTNESIWVSKKIAGTFHSKVGVVSTGFGHISTTLDPNWKGPLLISINNPTNKKLKLNIEDSFITLIFYRLESPATKDHDNDPSRILILKSLTDKVLMEELDDLKKLLIKKAHKIFTNSSIKTIFSEKVENLQRESSPKLIEAIKRYNNSQNVQKLGVNLLRIFNVGIIFIVIFNLIIWYLSQYKEVIFTHKVITSISSWSSIALFAILISSFQLTRQLKKEIK